MKSVAKDSTSPLVSIITATFNRSRILALCIETLRRQTVDDWEQIVVGDACSDDSAGVVASFADPRITFVNRAENCGEQSGPNNDGGRLARGRFVAYLNHDDFWFPEHLQAGLEHLEKTGADLVFSRGISLFPDGERRIMGAVPGNVYRPVADVHASLWLFRRELLDFVGPWRHSRACWAIPSQDWLIRAWRRRCKIMAHDRVTVYALHAGRWRDCYRKPGSEAHERVFREMTDDPNFRERELQAAALQAAQRQKSVSVRLHLADFTRALLYRPLLALRVPPVWVKYRLHSFRRGASVDRIQRFRGLPVKKRK